MEKKTWVLISIICFLSGLVLGVFAGVIKHGIGNNSGNTTNYYGKDFKEDENTDL
jgi:hypothetical protein